MYTVSNAEWVIDRHVAEEAPSTDVSRGKRHRQTFRGGSANRQTCRGGSAIDRHVAEEAPSTDVSRGKRHRQTCRGGSANRQTCRGGSANRQTCRGEALIEFYFTRTLQTREVPPIPGPTGEPHISKSTHTNN